MVEIKGLTKTYAGGRTRAVDGLDLEVKDGEIFGFIGPNGAGKTTTIKMIAGVLRPDTGSVRIAGVDMSAEPVRAKRNLGYVPDTHDAFDKLTGIEYLGFIADVYGVDGPERKEGMEKYLRLFDLQSAARDSIKSYSHGMRQKIMLAGALLHNPPLWILDEPMTGLDPASALLLKEAMREHCRSGHSVFFSTHVLDVAERLCHRIGIILGGKLAAVGTLEELRANAAADATLEQVFFSVADKQTEGARL
ncbi:MAG: ABC transporter ATP-binding protein [Oscillospiraceae bacterium]|jgi:ABC-2 type transport system ATP-binding protein|nr:ABC transporter ATP-binding protein [Oscillospiraceae bacterium]